MAQIEPQAHTSPLAADIQPPVKRRAACDECRTKKLKCGGEQPSCSRCVRENITCVYSPQKHMGRPKKRQRMDDEALGVAEQGKGERTASARQRRSWEPSAVGVESSLPGYVGLDDSTSYLTPGGSLQPWLHDVDWTVPGEHAIPGLTPDSSSNSPPTINPPAEMQSGNHIHHHSSHPDTSSSSHTHLEQPTQLLLDPSLVDPTIADTTNLTFPPSSNATCACLSTIYLTLSTLQNMSSDSDSFAFPYALHPLREAMQTASDVVACEHCPTKFLSMVQNTHLLGTLLMSIAERFSKVVEGITAEAARAESKGETKKFRLADLNSGTTTVHLHTGGLGCVAAFSVDLSPAEWRSMAKKVVRAEVHGPADGNACCPYYMELIKRMQERQESWHSGRKQLPEDFPVDGEGVPIGGPRVAKEQQDHFCLKFLGFAKQVVDALDWS